MSDKGRFLLRVPANRNGYSFLKRFKEYTNREEYKVVVRFSGKRTRSPYSTRKEEATSLRLYLEPRQGKGRSWHTVNDDEYDPFKLTLKNRSLRNENDSLKNKLANIKVKMVEIFDNIQYR